MKSITSPNFKTSHLQKNKILNAGLVIGVKQWGGTYFVTSSKCGVARATMPHMFHHPWNGVYRYHWAQLKMERIFDKNYAGVVYRPQTNKNLYSWPINQFYVATLYCQM